MIGVALLALVASSCTASGEGPSGGGASGGGSSGGASPPARTSSGTPEVAGPGSLAPAMTPGGSVGNLSASIMDPILADAAERSGRAIGDLVVVSAQARTWSNAGLGCPLPGVAYIQVPVDGYQVVVRAGGVSYDYRGFGPGRFRLCTAAPG